MAKLRSTIHLCVRLFLGIALSGCTTGDFGDSEAGLALEDLAQGLSPSRLSGQVPHPVRESISFKTAGMERAADLYKPSQGTRAGIVLVPGVAARGRRDARVVAVANTLARLNFTALVPHLRIHDLRHQYASFLVNSGRTLYEVQQILGHSDPSVTQRYAHLSKRSLQDAAGSANDVISKAMRKSA